MTDSDNHVSVSWLPLGNLKFTDHNIVGKTADSDISIIPNGNGTVIVPGLKLNQGGITFSDGTVQTSAVTQSQSQSDWSQIDPANASYIKNKPSVVLTNSENYASFYTTNAQSASSVTESYQLVFTATRSTDGSIVLDNNDIVFYESGTYFLNCSIQFSNSSNIQTDVTVWLRKNNSDVEYSGVEFTVPARTSGSNPSNISVAFSTILDSVAQNSHYQIMWQTDNTAVSIQSKASQSNPARPIIPGANLQIQRVK